MLVNGLIVGGMLFLFKYDKILTNNFVQQHTTDLIRLGLVAFVQAIVFLVFHLFTSIL